MNQVKKPSANRSNRGTANYPPLKGEHIAGDDDWAQAPPTRWNTGYRLQHCHATWREDPNRNRTRAGQFNKISRVTKIMMFKDRLDAWVSMSSGALDMSLFIDTTIPNTHNS